MPTRGASTSMPSNSDSTAVCVWASCLPGCSLMRAAACSAMSRRSWRPSNSIMSAAAYAASRAAPTSGPSAVTLRTRPPAVTTSPSASAVPAWVTSTPGGTRSRPRMTSPEEEDSG